MPKKGDKHPKPSRSLSLVPPHEDQAPELPSPDGLFRQILRDARALAGFDDPLDAELWVSGLMGVWRGIELHDEDPDRFFGLGLVDHAGKRLTPSALALLLGLSAVAPEEIATAARTAAERLTAKDVPAPRWQASIGSCAFTSAWSASNPYGDWELLVIGFAYPDRPAHSISVDVDHNAGGAITAAAVGPAPEEVLREWQEADGGENGDDQVEQLDAAEAARRLRAALAASERGAAEEGAVDDIVGEMLAADDLEDDALGIADGADGPDGADSSAGGLQSAKALLHARLRTLPGPADTGAAEPPDRQAVAEAFLAAPEASGLDRGDDREALESLLDFHEELRTGQPLRWSPALVEEMLLTWAPGELLGEPAAADDAVAARLPDVLTAFVRYAGRERGLAPRLIDETVAVVDELREDFHAAMGDPQGHMLSRAMTLAMQAAGVDVEDTDAREAWLEELGEQLNSLGDLDDFDAEDPDSDDGDGSDDADSKSGDSPRDR